MAINTSMSPKAKAGKAKPKAKKSVNVEDDMSAKPAKKAAKKKK